MGIRRGILKKITVNRIMSQSDDRPSVADHLPPAILPASPSPTIQGLDLPRSQYDYPPLPRPRIQRDRLSAKHRSSRPSGIGAVGDRTVQAAFLPNLLINYDYNHLVGLHKDLCYKSSPNKLCWM
jgi:hypothetical protein